MNILAMADESTLNCQRKYLRWPTKVLSFFRADLLKKTTHDTVQTKQGKNNLLKKKIKHKIDT